MTSKKHHFPLFVWSSQFLLAVIIVYIFTHVVQHNLHFPKHWTEGFGAWDGGIYMNIAKRGYYSLAATAFFPLYPLLIAIVHQITGFHVLRSAIVVSNAAFAVALVMFYDLLRYEYDDNLAKRVLWLLVVFPGGLFFTMAYTESLSLLFIVLFFHALQRGKWYMSMCWGMLATATHDLGVLLSVSALIYWWEKYREHGIKERVVRFLSMILIPLGLLLYMLFLQIHTGNALGFMKAQSLWNRRTVVPVYQLFHELLILNPHPHTWFQKNFNFVITVDILSGILFVALAVWMIFAKRIKMEWKIYYWLTLLITISTPQRDKLSHI